MSWPSAPARAMRACGLAAWLAAFGCGGSPSTPASSAPPSVPTQTFVPTAVAPVAGAFLANACTGDSWQFDWSEVQASLYHLQVFSPSGATVLDVADVPASIYTWSQPPTVEEAQRRGWKWRVQAQVGGTWRDWTPEIPFDVDPLSPRLLAPQAAARLDNGCQTGDEIAWDFEWTGCRGADRYHLFVIGPSAVIPVVDNDRLGQTSYAHRSRGYVAPGNDRGWTWRTRARIGGDWKDWTAPRSFDVEAVDSDCASLPPPPLLSPPDGAVFDQFPRTTTLTWSAVSGAASYWVDLQVCQPSGCVEDGAFTTVRGVTDTSYTFNFVGAQPGRWRVSSVNGGGVAGPPSGWWQFRYTR